VCGEEGLQPRGATRELERRERAARPVGVGEDGGLLMRRRCRSFFCGAVREREREGYENDRWGPCKGETEPSFLHVDT
jgi:hypothetical protein